MTISPLAEPFFRHEYGRLVAMLSRRAGMHHLDVVEDAVQSALLAAVASWTRGSVPDNPSAWLFRVAYNHVIGELRRRGRSDRLAARYGRDVSNAIESAPAAAFMGDVRDDILRMLFACCDEAIPVESQLVVALTTLCGFGVSEVAERLFTSEANVYKRLGRARSRLRALPFDPDEISQQQLAERLHRSRRGATSAACASSHHGASSTSNRPRVTLALCSGVTSGGVDVISPSRTSSGEGTSAQWCCFRRRQQQRSRFERCGSWLRRTIAAASSNCRWAKRRGSRVQAYFALRFLSPTASFATGLRPWTAPSWLNARVRSHARN